MEWLSSLIPSRHSRSRVISVGDYDPQAYYDSFKEHWQQILKIFDKVSAMPSYDDVLGVVNHLEQMITLLICNIEDNGRLCASELKSSCLEYLLTENILDKLFEWSMGSGRYISAIRCEQFKLYQMLIAQSRHVLLAHESFLRPMIKLLVSSESELFSLEVEKLLVDLISQLSALLMQNVDFIELFFQEVKNVQSFIIFSLLEPFIHREDSIGMRARDALLLCISLSKKNKKVAVYITEYSNFSVLIASGISGLYSVLPNILSDIILPEWHRFTPDDVNEIKPLLSFVTALEFFSAVAQVAHSTISKQLQEFMYRGFLIPVLGPALLQTSIQEQVAATSYLELILRTVTEPGLLNCLLHFLLKAEFDGQILLNILIHQMDSDKQLCLVSLALFDTIADLGCEDLMLELVFKHLQPCLHLMLSQRKILLPLDMYCQSLEKLLNLSPRCCHIVDETNFEGNNKQWSNLNYTQSLYWQYYAYLHDARSKIERCQMACMVWNNSYTGEDDIHNNSGNSRSLSYERSSGYGSLNMNVGKPKQEEEYWQISSNFRLKRDSMLTKIDDIEQSSPSAGPFLSILMQKLRNFLSNSFYINLHLTGLISRLATYPQPLLRAYLLDYSLVLQPNVPSLFEIIGLLKQKIDEYMCRRPDSIQLIRYARNCLVDREIMLENLRRYHVEQPNSKKSDTNESFQRTSTSRSIHIPPIRSLFGRPSPEYNSAPLVSSSSEIQFNVIYMKFSEGQHIALCAVLLDEWVKELAALAQEHTVAQLANLLK